MADVCLRYLIFPCFEANLTEHEMHQFLVQGYYAFEDYAIVHWLDHLEFCKRDVYKDQRLQQLRQSVELFLSKRGLSSSLSQHSISGEKDNSFRALGDRKISEQLQSIANLRGEKLSTLGHIDLESGLQQRRAAFEKFSLELVQDETLANQVSLIHGPYWFKCSRTWCEWFHEGFPDRSKRDQHVNQHERPFHCTYDGCPVNDIGYSSSKELKRHLAKSHLKGENGGWAFPTRKIRKESHFFKAAATGEVQVLKEMLHEGFDDINKTSVPKGYETALILAAKNNHVEAVKLLIQEGADIDLHRLGRGTALSAAIRAGHHMVVQELLSSGASLEGDGLFTSWSLVSFEDEAMLRVFLDHDVDLHARDSQAWSLLHLAADHNNSFLVMHLIEKGADVGAKAVDGRTALHLASGARLINEQILRLLIEASADVNAQDIEGYTALHSAADTGSIQSIKLLNANGSLIDKTSLDGWTPLWVAVRAWERIRKHLPNDQEIPTRWENHSNYTFQKITLLLELGAATTGVDKSGQTVLNYAVCSDDMAVVENLLEHGAEVNAADKYGETGLSMAILAGKTKMVRCLLEHGAQVNVRDDHGRTVLHHAVSDESEWSETIIKLLLDYGAEKDAIDDSGATALHDAISESHNEHAKLLLTAGVDVAIKKTGGRTALHLAALQGTFEIVETLLWNGADFNAMDHGGQTALHLAASHGFIDVTRSLLSYLDVANMEDKHSDKQSIASPSIQQSPVQMQAYKDHQMQIHLSEMQNKRHQMPSNLAFGSIDHEAVRKLLLEKGLNPDEYVFSSFLDYNKL